MRADAQRNRAQIVAAARALFLDEGLTPPMEEIARRAGVGVGTLYRRFPDRDTLIHTVAADTLRLLGDTARTAWEEEPDAWHALSRFLHRCSELQLGRLQSMLDAQQHETIRANPELHQTRQAVTGILQQIIEQAKVDNALRRDVDLADIATLMTLQVHPHSQVPTHIIQIVLDGLRAQTRSQP